MATATAPTLDPALEKRCIDTIRTLAMDAVQAAESGHPGTPMALAPLAYLLFTRHLRHDPKDPHWPDRDRFVLSVGHASMLLYSVLHLSGYDLSLEELKQFRQWESRTPGHPEYGYTPGVETTTGPLGQGIGNAVGMAVAEAHLAATFNREGHAVVDHHTYFIAGDGDLMEGVSHEAASFAGHFGLGKLIGFYDDNQITIDGRTDLTYSDDAGKRFEAYGWHVQHVADVNDLAALDAAIAAAKAETARPSLIIVKTIIGFGSPNRADSSKAHGEPLGKEEVVLTKRAYGWPSEQPFFVPDDAREAWLAAGRRQAEAHGAWTARWDAYRAAEPALAAEFERRLAKRLPDGWDAAVPSFTAENGAVASRAASGTVLNALAAKLPELMGGSADLAPSNNTALKGLPAYSAATPGGRNMHFGVREHGMGAIMNGMALHGGIVPYGGTFLVFADYMRPAIRLAALMHQQVLYVFTHDSIGLGEDGPTHQPVEQLTALRCIPNLTVMRPADASETAEAWKVAVAHRDGPVALVLTRQKLGYIDRTKYASAEGVARGAYVLRDADGGAPQVVLMSSGSEVALVLEAARKLEAEGIRARTVSVPSMELFAKQDAEYQRAVLPAGVPRVAIEAAHPMSWYRLVGDRGTVLGIERFGASAPYQRIFEELGLTVDRVVEAARRVVKG
ncbi:transketolase [Roseisolibacter sp. H3M3-2]|uniref:transketolase n=1 Tax=Roseisolibacter sp. H3M3-2 TaxID=3031323 RepID=UPI0023DC1AE7|nr:transketolase [Roseisolibacter sp. H3M3-2]MDF1504632.1 transketolase [Roseisolibacter sp. H3M3-2]